MADPVKVTLRSLERDNRYPREPEPSLGALRRALGLSTDDAAAMLNTTVATLVNTESKPYGYDPMFDFDAFATYLRWAIAAYGDTDLFRQVFQDERPPLQREPFRATKKGHLS